MAASTPPLAGCKVLDLGIITAGAATSALLADAGADVVKIESARYPDPFRVWTSGAAGSGEEGSSPVFRFTNRNKLGLAIDLKTDAGRALFLRLAAEADVVVENFRRGVLEKLGVGWDALRAANPRLVLASVSSQGETGPDRGFTSYGSTLEATGGMAALTGYAGGSPKVTGRDLNYPDQVVSVFAMGAVVAAVMNARRTGAGAHLDISQREVVAFLLGEAVAATAESEVATSALRRGNADPAGRPQGCFRSADGRWIAVTLQDDAARAGAASLVGEAATEAALGRWIAGKSAGDAIAALRRAGVAAAPVLSGVEALAKARQAGRTLAAAPGGGLVKGFPFQSARAPFAVRKAAPAVGEDTGDVLSRLFGLSPQEIEALRAAGATR